MKRYMPPLGLMPEFLHKEKRLTEVREAIKRYLDASMRVPLEWITEEHELVRWVSEWRSGRTEAQAIPDEEEKKEGFVWTDELVGEFGNWYKENQGNGRYWGFDLLEVFKKIKSTKEEPQQNKGWEIVAFEKNGKILRKIGGDFKFRNDTNSISDLNFLVKNYHIYSVKRLSDGEVFSVGDEVTWGNRFYSPKITAFYIEDERLRFKFVGEYSGSIDFMDARGLLTSTPKPKSKLYTEEEVEKAFNAAQMGVCGFYNFTPTFESFSEYKKSLNQ